MMTNDSIGDGGSFIIPARTLRGSKREMVDDIDQAIVGLLALRHLVDGGAPPPEALELGGGRRPQPHETSWPRLFTAFRQAWARSGRLRAQANGRRNQWRSSEVL
jgi:hypothetical protein